MVLFARQLAGGCCIDRETEEAARFSRDAEQLSREINRRMWDRSKNFYFDLTLDGKRAPVKTVAAFWTLIANVASHVQASALVAQLKNPATFGRLNKVPTLSADEPGYDAAGGYWRGSVWAPTVTMVIRGLEKYGYTDFAREAPSIGPKSSGRGLREDWYHLGEMFARRCATGQTSREQLCGLEWTGTDYVHPRVRRRLQGGCTP